jgi:hypothetical protein
MIFGNVGRPVRSHVAQNYAPSAKLRARDKSQPRTSRLFSRLLLCCGIIPWAALDGPVGKKQLTNSSGGFDFLSVCQNVIHKARFGEMSMDLYHSLLYDNVKN